LLKQKKSSKAIPKKNFQNTKYAKVKMLSLYVVTVLIKNLELILFLNKTRFLKVLSFGEVLVLVFFFFWCIELL
jgi:hypothetical protein